MMDFSSINSHDKQNGEYHHKTVFPPSNTSDSFSINTTPKISAIKRTKQILPFNYLFQPVDPPLSSSHNNHGICVKVIEYVLEIEKRRLTDQASVYTQGADCSEHTPKNYDTDSMENQVYIPSNPNIRHTPNSKSSIVITHNGANKKCIPSVPTTKLTPYNQIMYEKSVEIYNLSKIKKPVESTSQIEQNGFPQISNSTGKQYFSSFARYIPNKIPDKRLIPNRSPFENRKETKNVYRPYNDTSKFQLSNEVENHQSIIINTFESKPTRIFCF